MRNLRKLLEKVSRKASRIKSLALPKFICNGDCDVLGMHRAPYKVVQDDMSTLIPSARWPGQVYNKARPLPQPPRDTPAISD